ncbi:MAG: hypothetical protein ABJH05_17160 [Fulvivirga sp.]
MKKFITHVLLFAVLFSGVLAGIKLSVPYYWGANDDFITKTKYLQTNDKKFERIIFGSSMTLRAIKPFVFDENTKSDLETFNLSAAHTFHFETKYLLKNFISDYPSKEIIFLVQKPTPIHDKNLHSVSSKYYLNLETFWEAAKFYKSDQHQLYNYTLSFIENILCIGEIVPIIEYHIKNTNPQNKNQKINQKRGYYSLEQVLKDSDNKDLSLLKRKKFFKNKKIPPLHKRKMNISRYGNKEQRATYIESLKDVNNIIEEKGMEVVFLVMPNDPIFKLLDKEDLTYLYMGSAKSFPQYFSKKFKFDVGHLNERGALLFSKKMGRKYDRISNNN